jgi:hypothetical protein
MLHQSGSFIEMISAYGPLIPALEGSRARAFFFGFCRLSPLYIYLDGKARNFDDNLNFFRILLVLFVPDQKLSLTRKFISEKPPLNYFEPLQRQDEYYLATQKKEYYGHCYKAVRRGE